jgi:signal transduction histidine kinase
MQQALSNLLLNAVMHTPAGTAISVQAQKEGTDLVIRVVDNGPGLPPDLLPRIFDKFVRASHAPTGGSGLGLAIVKSQIEAIGGRVWVEHASPGARFVVELDAA